RPAPSLPGCPAPPTGPRGRSAGSWPRRPWSAPSPPSQGRGPLGASDQLSDTDCHRGHRHKEGQVSIRPDLPCQASAPNPITSVGPGQPEHVLAEVVERHLLRDRSYSIKTDLAPQPLDVVLPRVAKTAKRLQSGVAGREAGFGGQELGGVRF